MYLDEVFLQQQIEVNPRYDFPLSLVRPFSGYLHVIVRVGFLALPLISLEHLPVLIFLVSTLVWSLCTLLIFRAVKGCSSTTYGLAAATAFVLLPPTNMILLSQMNALQWPLLTALTIAAATDFRPTTKLGERSILVLMVTTSLSAALAFIPLSLIAFNALKLRGRSRLLLLTVGSLSYLPQVISYLVFGGRQVGSPAPSDLWREFSYIAKTLLPPQMRPTIDEALPVSSIVVLFALGLFLCGVLATGFISGRKKHPVVAHRSVIVTATGLCAGLISVFLNGNLNHQYLMIPLTCLWVSVVLSISVLRSTVRNRFVLPLLTGLTIAVFMFSSALTWPRDFKDPFFVAPQMIDWQDSYDDAAESCGGGQGTTSLELQTASFRVDCSRLD